MGMIAPSAIAKGSSLPAIPRLFLQLSKTLLHALRHWCRYSKQCIRSCWGLDCHQDSLRSSEPHCLHQGMLSSAASLSDARRTASIGGRRY